MQDVAEMEQSATKCEESAKNAKGVWNECE